MLTTFPAVVVFLAAIFWTLARPFDPADVAALAIPGGATIQLLRLGWHGLADGGGTAAWLAAAAPSIAATLLVTAAATAGAVRWFRWEPRP